MRWALAPLPENAPLTERSTNVVAVGCEKGLVQDVAGMPVSDALVADTVQRIAAIRSSAEGKEGVQAFLEKRKPNWLA